MCHKLCPSIQRHEPVPCVQVLSRVVSRPGARLSPENSPICSLRSACSETSFRRIADSRFFASLLDVRWRLKNVWAGSLACRISISLSHKNCPLLAKIPLVCLPSAGNLRSLPLKGCRVHLSVNRIGMSSNLRPVFQSTRSLPQCDEFQQVQPSDPVCAMCLVVRSTWVQIRETLVVIEVLSVFRSRFSTLCPVTFCSPRWFSPTKGSSACSLALFSPKPELRSSLRIGVLRCFASVMFFLMEFQCHADPAQKAGAGTFLQRPVS